MLTKNEMCSTAGLPQPVGQGDRLGFISKPFRPEQLAQAVREGLDKCGKE